MPKTRKATRRAAKPSRASAARRVRKPAGRANDFCAVARDALKRGEPDAISDDELGVFPDYEAFCAGAH